jgi:hypothetical protein
MRFAADGFFMRLAECACARAAFKIDQLMPIVAEAA